MSDVERTSKERTRHGHLMVLREILHHGTVETGAWEAAIRYAIRHLEAQSPDETTADCSTGTGGVTLAQMAENIKHGVDPYTGDQMDIEAIRFLAAGQDDPQSMALAACANEIDRLRAKSNSRPEGLIRSEVAAEIMDAIDELIKPGKLQGSGWDETAQRNGLILAYNTISQKFGEYRAPEASPLKADGEPRAPSYDPPGGLTIEGTDGTNTSVPIDFK